MFPRRILSAFAALPLLLASAMALSAAEITHAMGTTEVPENPQRVVVLTNEGTEALLAVGIKPVGAVRSWLGDPWYDHIAEQMEGVEVVGEESAVNLELIAALQPDLIIGNKTRQEKIYEQLSTIAPTVFSERLRGDWKINFAVYTEAVGKRVEGENVLARFDAKLAALSKALGDRKAEKISLVRFMAGRTRIYYKDTFAGIILSQIGFARPASQDKDTFADEVTKERIPEMDGDRLFYFVYETGDGDAEARAAEWTDEPLWKNLEAVKTGKVYPVDDAIWNTAGGVIAANLMLDDIARVYDLQLP
ncbi:iron-siderophore ABC transporter substrate-binding protein [Chelativorans sp. SCAU2101]|jgi:ABC-type Fe3+-hydroxamate transport system, periplasmic component|uniref:Iron-siderophore ABC transporter substrate-binding protein n=1 Tax=Chelativorans petroleitrophicus TaxID=2975484 RepID=A0A9X2XBW3_9HYPH|nr:iron-siderophore ABC transporter substrate-binding protein [Chelativorans petroleitrophicus]MCT8991470.1 iron-siderophore ABC transporter substrate-binding protein [Chelativorans petroleitrophicus]